MQKSVLATLLCLTILHLEVTKGQFLPPVAPSCDTCDRAGRSCVLFNQRYIGGNGIGNGPARNYNQCSKTCNEGCKYWSFRGRGRGWCFLYSSVEGTRYASGWISGPEGCPPPGFNPDSDQDPGCFTFSGNKCKFPFTYGDQTFSQCTSYKSLNNRPYCLTEGGNYEDCDISGFNSC
eukprot:GFUD01058065.1.p1 GENE.GFUD01058065.1~~GFUD01058065.1.p1  ORF type:complete len:177 (-),score=12.36 GFUD01058065.1:326-856(-)